MYTTSYTTWSIPGISTAAQRWLGEVNNSDVRQQGCETKYVKTVKNRALDMFLFFCLFVFWFFLFLFFFVFVFFYLADANIPSTDFNSRSFVTNIEKRFPVLITCD